MLRNNRTHARTCGDCRFMTERMGVLRTHCECLEPSQSGRRVGEKDAACPLFASHMVKPGPSLAELLGADTRRAVSELTAEKPARPERRGTQEGVFKADRACAPGAQRRILSLQLGAIELSRGLLRGEALRRGGYVLPRRGEEPGEGLGVLMEHPRVLQRRASGHHRS